MRNALLGLVVVALLAAVGCSSGPEGTYKKFADSWAANKVSEAISYAGSEGARTAIGEKTINALMGNAIQTPMGSSHSSIQTSSGTGPGEVVVQADQVVMYNPPGVESALRATMAARIHHTVTLARTADGWKVMAFNPTLVKTEEIGH